MKYVGGTKLDERVIRTDLDPGFQEGRQYGQVPYLRLPCSILTETVAASPVVKSETSTEMNSILDEAGTAVPLMRRERRRKRNMAKADDQGVVVNCISAARPHDREHRVGLQEDYGFSWWTHCH